MSAPTVAVTALLIEVLARLDQCEDLPPSEAALVDLLWPHMQDLVRIWAMATREMQALAPAMLAADRAWAGGAA